MPRYQRTLDIWSLDAEQVARLQPGQWVTAGGARGVFCGVRESGTVVVMWQENARSHNYRIYRKTLMDYGRKQCLPHSNSTSRCPLKATC